MKQGGASPQCTRNSGGVRHRISTRIKLDIDAGGAQAMRPIWSDEEVRLDEALWRYFRVSRLITALEQPAVSRAGRPLRR